MIKQKNGLPVDKFNIGDKAMMANPYLTVGSRNKWDDVFTVVETTLTFGKWKAVVNDRTKDGYVMGDGDYCRVEE